MSESAGVPERQRIEAAVDEEVAAMASDDIDRLLAVLADDAVFLPPNLAPKKGVELAAWLREFLAEWRIEWLAFSHDDVEEAGDLAYERFSYRWRVTPKGSGDPLVAPGKGVHVLRRESDGRWKIAREIWNSSPPT